MFDAKYINKLVYNCEYEIKKLENKLYEDLKKEFIGKYFLNEEDVVYAYGNDEGYENKTLQITGIYLFDGHDIGIKAIINGKTVDFDITDIDNLKIANTPEELEVSNEKV